MQIRELDGRSEAEVDLVTHRMFTTLVEVLDEERASELFSIDTVRSRLLWHLEAVPGRRAAVFVSEDSEGRITGHTIVRADDEDGREIGLFSTTYVEPAGRRSGTASALLARGERWMRDQRLLEAATYTDVQNEKLIRLYEKHGYEIEIIDEEWARASKPLD